MPWPIYELFGRVEVECWSAGAKGARHARAGVGMNGWGDFKAGEYGQRVRARGAIL